jgi:hypothetical protein
MSDLDSLLQSVRDNAPHDVDIMHIQPNRLLASVSVPVNNQRIYVILSTQNNRFEISSTIAKKCDFTHDRLKMLCRRIMPLPVKIRECEKPKNVDIQLIGHPDVVDLESLYNFLRNFALEVYFLSEMVFAVTNQNALDILSLAEQSIAW